MSKTTPYSIEERKIIRDCISRNPNNIKKGFEDASSLLPGRSSGGIQNFWYTKFVKELKKKKDPIFITGSKHVVVVNRKNSPRKHPHISSKVVGKTRLDKILELPAHERRIAFQMYKNDRQTSEL